MDNASCSCITAAAGTCISHNFDLHLYQNFKSTHRLYSYHNIQFTYTKLPDRTFVHCPEFPTAAKSKVVYIPYVTDYSLNSAIDR